MKKLSRIDESTWNDLRRQSAGTRQRLEDDIDGLDRKGLFEYLREIYDCQGKDKIDVITDYDIMDTISVIPFEIMDGYEDSWFHLEFRHIDKKSHLFGKDKNKTVCFNYEYSNRLPDLYAAISEKYDTDDFVDSVERLMAIRPKDKSETTNSFYVEVIDFILSQVDGELLVPWMFRKNNEAIWNSIRRQAAGVQEREEDNCKGLTIEEFCDYIRSHYKLVDKFDNGYTDIISHNQIYTSMSVLAICEGYKQGTSYYHLALSKKEDGYIIKFRKTAKGLEIYKLLAKEFDFSEATDSWDYVIRPKDGGEVDNEFFIKVLDFIIDNTKYPEESALERK